MKAIRNSKGFTLMELIVVLGVLALLAAILVPIVFDYVEDARRAKAKGDVNAIRIAIANLQRDTSKWPISDGTKDLVFLYSGTTAPEDDTLPEGDSDSLDDHLLENGTGESPEDFYKGKWNGSYVDTNIGNDAWGKPYMVYAEKLAGTSGKHAWILSAGPNRDYETGPEDAKLQGDDIGIKIR